MSREIHEKRTRTALSSVMRRISRLTGANNWSRTRPILRAAVKAAIDAGYDRGYCDGHEWQLKMRIQDAKECREKNGRHL